MTLSQNGIDYICINFGDAANHCCVNAGLSWYSTREGVDYPETGGTAQIVSRLALGLMDTLTMTNPATGTFTRAELDAANGSSVTLEDAQQIASHDEPSEDQWCYLAVGCAEYQTQSECIAAGCYWWSDNTCHDTQETLPPPDIPDWWWIPVVAGVTLIGIYAVIKKRR